MTGPQMAMVAIMYVLGMGVFLRKRPYLHTALMGSAIVADLTLTLYLELARKVIKTSIDVDSEFHGNRALLYVHIGIALTLLSMYPVMIVTGRRLLRKADDVPRTRATHARFGMILFCLYFASFVTAPNSMIEKLFLS